MSIEKLDILAEYESETSIDLIETAYKYLKDKKSVPLKKLSLAVRVPFSAIYQFLRTQPQKQIEVIEKMNNKLPADVLAVLKEKIYLLYGQNYSKVGLLTNYK